MSKTKERFTEMSLEQILTTISNENGGLFIHRKEDNEFRDLFIKALNSNKKVARHDSFKNSVLIERFYKKSSLTIEEDTTHQTKPIVEFLMFLMFHSNEIEGITEEKCEEYEKAYGESAFSYIKLPYTKYFNKKRERIEHIGKFDNTWLDKHFEKYPLVEKEHIEQFKEKKYYPNMSIEEVLKGVAENYDFDAEVFLEKFYGDGYNYGFNHNDGMVERKFAVIETDEYYDLFAYYAYYGK